MQKKLIDQMVDSALDGKGITSQQALKLESFPARSWIIFLKVQIAYVIDLKEMT